MRALVSGRPPRPPPPAHRGCRLWQCQLLEGRLTIPLGQSVIKLALQQVSNPFQSLDLHLQRRCIGGRCRLAHRKVSAVARITRVAHGPIVCPEMTHQRPSLRATSPRSGPWRQDRWVNSGGTPQMIRQRASTQIVARPAANTPSMIASSYMFRQCCSVVDSSAPSRPSRPMPLRIHTSQHALVAQSGRTRLAPRCGDPPRRPPFERGPCSPTDLGHRRDHSMPRVNQ